MQSEIWKKKENNSLQYLRDRNMSHITAQRGEDVMNKE